MTGARWTRMVATNKAIWMQIEYIRYVICTIGAKICITNITTINTVFPKWGSFNWENCRMEKAHINYMAQQPFVVAQSIRSKAWKLSEKATKKERRWEERANHFVGGIATLFCLAGTLLLVCGCAFVECYKQNVIGLIRIYYIICLNVFFMVYFSAFCVLFIWMLDEAYAFVPMPKILWKDPKIIHEKHEKWLESTHRQTDWPRIKNTSEFRRKANKTYENMDVVSNIEQNEGKVFGNLFSHLICDFFIDRHIDLYCCCSNMDKERTKVCHRKYIHTSKLDCMVVPWPSSKPICWSKQMIEWTLK